VDEYRHIIGESCKIDKAYIKEADFGNGNKIVEDGGKGIRQAALDIQTFMINTYPNKVIFDEIEYNYSASGFGTYIGLADSEGNVVLPEIYSYIIPVLGDRIIASAHGSMVGYTAYRLYDSECNLLCENYSYIDFLPIDREDYEKGFVGVAKIDYPEHQSPLICRDENGEILPGGLWFVDKNGKPLSERFDIDMIDIEFSADDKLAFVKDVEGNVTEIPVGDYIIEKDW
jgi:hypothetical protein